MAAAPDDSQYDYPTDRPRPDPGRPGHRRPDDPDGARPGARSEADHLQGTDPRDGRRRREVPPKRVLRAAGAALGPGHVRGPRPPQAASHRGLDHGVSRHGRDRHRSGRPPRHRQEPGGHDAGGRGLQGGEPRSRRLAGEVLRGRRGARRDHRRHLGPHDHHDAGHEAHDRRPRPGRAPGPREGHGRRRAGQPGLRRGDRRRRPRAGRDARGRAGEGAVRGARWRRPASVRSGR